MCRRPEFYEENAEKRRYFYFIDLQVGAIAWSESNHIQVGRRDVCF